MESSTLTPAAEDQGVIFHSEASNYRLVRDPMRRRQLGEANEFEVVPGTTYEFVDGVLRVTDSDDIEWLRNSDSYGRFFWEIGGDGDRTQNSADLQKLIMQKALSGDFDGIADILVAERSALSRPEVIASCTAALEAADQGLPAPPATPLHEQQRVRMGPAAGITPGVSPDPVVGSPQVDPSTLEPVPGGDAAAPGAPAVPPGQDPAVGETPDGTSDTMPNAQGPQAGEQPPYGTPEAPPAPPAPGAEEDAPEADGEGETPEAELGQPGAPAVPEDEQQG